MRRATKNKFKHHDTDFIISIHALHEESDEPTDLRALSELEISIHALHEESDYQNAKINADLSISIHALHEESDA